VFHNRQRVGLRQQSRSTPNARRGRPPSASAHRAILEAARGLLVERDLAHLHLEQVAARAGVGKATLYRHFPTRESLAIELLLEMATDVHPARDRGDTRAELIAIVDGTVRALTRSPLGRVMQGLFSELALNPEIAAPFRAVVVRAKRAAVADVLARGKRLGDIRDSADVELATELLIGPVYYRLLFGGDFDTDFASRVVDALLVGYMHWPDG
jgi:AcrR family transcriptional regulator